MEQTKETGSGKARQAPPLSILAAATAGVFVAYSITVWAALDLSVPEALAGGAANTVPVIVFGLPARQLIVRGLVGRPLALQVAGHLVLGAAFTVFAYWLLMVLLGLVTGVSALEFDVRPFSRRGAAWQLLENVTVYGLIAALSYLQTRRDPVAIVLSGAGREGQAQRDQALSRYFIRSGEEIRPIDVDLIVSISGADDYAEVATVNGRHLVRMTLSEFEKALDPAKFVRIHRSRIVNLDRVARAEPAGGGRMLLHMEDGEMITASRTGSRLLRDRVL
ncbi:MAG TPA: LytTR family DNA-binding domain-containing protein [Caulobacteraceae bacterium]|jgi:hypothetical protein